MSLSRTKSRLTISAPPPSPIPTGTGSRSAGNETFKQFLDSAIHLPQLSLPRSRFVSGANPSPAVVDFEVLASNDGGHAAALMLRSATDFGAFRIVNHGISGEEIFSAVNEAKYGLEDCDEGYSDRAAIFQVWRRRESAASENTVVPAETYRDFSEKTENIASKLEGIAEKLGEILWEKMEMKWDENMNKGEKDTIFSIYKYNHQNQIGKKLREKEKSESVMLNLQIPVEHCQFLVNINDPHHQQAHSFCFDAAAHSIVVTIGKKLEEWSLGKLKSARSDEIIVVPDLDGNYQTFFSIELKFSYPNLLNHHSHSNIISISDQIFIAFIIISLYFLYTNISSFFKGK